MKMLNLRVALLVAVLLLAYICNVGGAPGPDLGDILEKVKNRIQGKSDLEAAAEKGWDLVTGDRKLQVSENPFTGKKELSISMTTEDKIWYAGIAVGVVVALIGCCCCFAGCCKTKRPRAVVVYKEPTPPVAGHQAYQPQAAPAHSVAGQGLYPSIHGWTADGSKVPPPPYSGKS